MAPGLEVAGGEGAVKRTPLELDLRNYTSPANAARIAGALKRTYKIETRGELAAFVAAHGDDFADTWSIGAQDAEIIKRLVLDDGAVELPIERLAVLYE